MSDYRLFTLRQAAAAMGVRWDVVRDLIETGQLRAVKIGARYRIPAAALAELGTRQDVPPPVLERPASPRPLRALRGS